MKAALEFTVDEHTAGSVDDENPSILVERSVDRLAGAMPDKLRVGVNTHEIFQALLVVAIMHARIVQRVTWHDVTRLGAAVKGGGWEREGATVALVQPGEERLRDAQVAPVVVVRAEVGAVSMLRVVDLEPVAAGQGGFIVVVVMAQDGGGETD